MEYMVVYSSKTGNTKKIATEIFSALPGMSKDMQSMEEYRGKDAEIFFIGFWVNRGTCDISVINMLSELHGKKVALFGTCGMGREAAYFKAIEQKVNVWVPDDCEYLGTFLCQGKCQCRCGRIMRFLWRTRGRKYGARKCSEILMKRCSIPTRKIWSRQGGLCSRC